MAFKKGHSAKSCFHPTGGGKKGGKPPKSPPRGVSHAFNAAMLKAGKTGS